ncbi:MAG: adenosylcobinamide-GDP ribazoletransferase, partial [Lachnospiraceae bacterium]|nr:adenosylcobinamide-GDP ribazoletransferase [Candidatus Equihabitans merdae]
FILARMLSGMSVIMFKNARGSGSLMAFQEETDQRKAEVVFYVQIAVFIVIILLNGLIRGVPALIAGVAMVWASALIFWLYYYRSKKIFGGITGDLAGWFLCLCELGQVAALALVSLFI